MVACPKPVRTKTKASKAKCVALSGKIVTCKGHCMKCYTNANNDTIDPHHIVPGRADRIVARTDAQIPLCRHDCHRWAHDSPALFKIWVDSRFPGRRQMLEAVVHSQPGVKVDWDKVYKGLVDEAKICGLIK